MCAYVRRSAAQTPIFHFVMQRPNMNVCIRAIKTRAFIQQQTKLYLQQPTRYNQQQQLTRFFRTKSNQQQQQQNPDGPSMSRSVLKNFLFTSLVCGGCFAGCMIWQQENMEKRATDFRRRNVSHRTVVTHCGDGPEDTLKSESLNYLPSVPSQNRAASRRNEDGLIFPKALQFRRDFMFEKMKQFMIRWWNSQSDSAKWQYSMIGSYLAVFAMWRAGVPAASVMMKYFTSRPTGNPLISNLLSCFSHYSFLHLFCNGYVFLSFAPPVIDTLGLEQSAALYISGGVIASFAGIIPKLIRGIQVSSLGASGAIMCYLGYVCTTMPDSRLSIAFISEIFPHSFSAQQGLIGLMAMDTLGLILGWKLFDHAAHLGGVIFGIWYAKYGRDWVWSKRHQVQKLWRQIKSDSN